MVIPESKPIQILYHNFFYIIISMLVISSLPAQNRSQMDKKDNNPLLCDIQTGACTTGDTVKSDVPDIKSAIKPLTIIYFTDPICSSCWGIEPQLRKLKLEYGAYFDIDYRMGGLLPDWSYNSGGISKPSDVAHHWDEVSLHYDMPIDGDVWLEDPLDSSYPPSIAFKAAQIQDKEKAVVFLRRLRELLFLNKKNITKWPYIAEAAVAAGLDTTRLRSDYEGGAARQLFEEDLAYARKLGVRGFPSVFIADGDQQTEFIYGTKPYVVYEGAILKLLSEAAKEDYPRDPEALFRKFGTMTAREYAVLSGLERRQAEADLDRLADAGKVRVIKTKNGNMYSGI